MNEPPFLWQDHSLRAARRIHRRGLSSHRSRDRVPTRATVPARSINNYTRLFPESGDFTGRVDIWSYGRLCYLLSKSQFSGLSDRYAAAWTDDRTFTVTATASGNTKTVSEYGGVGPIELWGIQEAIDSIAQGVNWTPKGLRKNNCADQ